MDASTRCAFWFRRSGGKSRKARPRRISFDIAPGRGILSYAVSCHQFFGSWRNAGYERMQDMNAQLEKLQLQMAECEMIAKLATDRAKRQLFGRLAEHYRTLAGEVERAIAAKPAC